jgi:hypothetical protein
MKDEFLTVGSTVLQIFCRTNQINVAPFVIFHFKTPVADSQHTKFGLFL